MDHIKWHSLYITCSAINVIKSFLRAYYTVFVYPCTIIKAGWKINVLILTKTCIAFQFSIRTCLISFQVLPLTCKITLSNLAFSPNSEVSKWIYLLSFVWQPPRRWSEFSVQVRQLQRLSSADEEFDFQQKRESSPKNPNFEENRNRTRNWDSSSDKKFGAKREESPQVLFQRFCRRFNRKMSPRRKLWSKFNVCPKVIYGNAAFGSFIKVLIHYLRCSLRVL